MTKIDTKAEIQYWKEQCDCLKKDVRLLRRELYWKDFCGEDKYQEFKKWAITNHSDVWIVKGIFDAFEKEYDKGNDAIIIKDCFHCAYAQSNEDGINCYRETKKGVKGTDTCEYYKKIGDVK